MNTRYETIPCELFIENRKKFCACMLPDSVAIFVSNDLMPTNADGHMLFRQNNDLFYLCGIDQEESYLILFPQCKEPKWREILFIRESNETIETWEGKKLSKQDATEISGIKTVYWSSQFYAILQQFIYESTSIYLNHNEHIRAESQVITRERRLIDEIRSKFPLHPLERSAKIMHALRMLKHPVELQLIRTAIEITKNAFLRALRYVAPGRYEFEIEAEITHEFISKRATRHAYPPIIASGASSCVLHYISNHNKCLEGELLLLDFGAEYANYNADLTRTIPVSGRFTERQKQVYRSVLNIQKRAKSRLIVGNTFEKYNEEVAKCVEQELLILGLITQEDLKKQDALNPMYKKYFMHGASHHLGLDVHDVGSKYAPFAPGMVLTCEPGIYIRNEQIGIRLENNILITENGPVDLTEDIPVEIEDIEFLMNRSR